jgi:AraC family transcriptional regulator
MTEPNGPTEAEPLHENVVRIDSRVRRWNGVTIADVHEYTKGEVLHPLVNEQETGIAMALEEVGGVTEPRVRPNLACDLDHRPNHMTLVPRGMPLWGHATKELRDSRYALLLFDLDALQRSFQDDFRPEMSERPRMRFTDTRIHSLVRMLVEMPSENDSAALLGDSLTAAVFALLSTGEPEPPEAERLSDRNLRLVAECLQDQLPRQIELRELAALADMSQWHLSRAFKAATGLSPYQWQLGKRVELVRNLLLQSDLSLDAIAKAAGFSSQTHLSQVFKQRVGTTPPSWQRSKR